MALLLAEWARDQRIDLNRAYRMFHRGDLRDAQGHPVFAEKSGSGSIYVYPEGPPDPLAAISAEALVAKLAEAGYVVLTTDQAARLGVLPSPGVHDRARAEQHRAPATSRRRGHGRDNDG